MMDISIPEILTNVKIISRDPDKNFPGNGKFPNPKFPVPISREETLLTVDVDRQRLSRDDDVTTSGL